MSETRTVTFQVDPALSAYIAWLDAEGRAFDLQAFDLFAVGYRAAEAERDRLRAALEPLVEFVDAVTAIDAHYASGHPNMTPEMAQAWPGVCERAQAARAALAGQTAGGGGGKKNGGE